MLTRVGALDAAVRSHRVNVLLAITLMPMVSVRRLAEHLKSGMVPIILIVRGFAPPAAAAVTRVSI